MSTTTNRPTPATATKLHSMLDDMLSPTRASAPEPAAVAPTAGSLVDDLNAIARRSQPQQRRMTTPQPEPVALHETAYNWDYDPTPTASDPLGIRERLDALKIGIAARAAHDAPHRLERDPHMEARATRLAEAQQQIEELLG